MREIYDITIVQIHVYYHRRNSYFSLSIDKIAPGYFITEAKKKVQAKNT